MHYARTARFYHFLERLCLGGALLKARLAYLQQLSDHGPVEHVLLVGEGNGSFLIPFVQCYPEARVTVLDESPEMLTVAKARLRRAQLDRTRMEFKVGDLRAMQLPEEHYDLIVTHFFFDNFAASDIRQMTELLQQAAAPYAQWLIADFCIPNSGWRALRARLWLKLMYGFFGLLAEVPTRRLTEVKPYLARAGFASLGEQHNCGQLLFSAHYRRSSD